MCTGVIPDFDPDLENVFWCVSGQDLIMWMMKNLDVEDQGEAAQTILGFMHDPTCNNSNFTVLGGFQIVFANFKPIRHVAQIQTLPSLKKIERLQDTFIIVGPNI